MDNDQMVITNFNEELLFPSEEKRKLEECITEMEEALRRKNEEHTTEMEKTDA